MRKCARRTRLTVTALAVMLLFAFLPTVQAEASVTNGDFENGKSNWIWQAGANGVLAGDGQQHGGDSALRLSNDSTDVTGYYVQQYITGLVSGDRLTLSYWLRTKQLCTGDNSSARVGIGFIRRNSGVNEASFGSYHAVHDDVTGDEWVQKKITLVVPDGANAISLMLRIWGTGEVYYDDVELLDAGNQTTLAICRDGLEIETFDENTGPLTAKLHYVAEPGVDELCMLFAFYETIGGAQELCHLEIKTYAVSAPSLWIEEKIPDFAYKGNLEIAVYAWGAGYPLSPVAKKVVPYSDGGRRNPVFAKFTSEPIRGIYGGISEINDDAILQKTLDAGCNTAILNLIGSRDGADMNKDTAALETALLEVEAWMEKTGADVFIKASCGSGAVVPYNTYDVYHPGKAHTAQLACPLSEEYWRADILTRLETVARHPKFIGVVIDLEMYKTGSPTRYATPCFCDACTADFIKENSEWQALSGVAIEERYSYSKENAFYEAYVAWQKAEVTKIFTEIRERLHAINPNLIIGNMPGYEWLPGITEGLGTPQMPLVVFSEDAYAGNLSNVYMYRDCHVKRDKTNALFCVGLMPKSDDGIAVDKLAPMIAESGTMSVGYWMYSLNILRDEFAAGVDYFAEIEKGNNQLTDKMKKQEE